MTQNRMLYRIVEFAPCQTYPKGAYFIETGQPHKKHVWWIFYKTEIAWNTVMDDDSKQEEPRPLKFVNYKEALDAVMELKKMQPNYHIIK